MTKPLPFQAGVLLSLPELIHENQFLPDAVTLHWYKKF